MRTGTLAIVALVLPFALSTPTHAEPEEPLAAASAVSGPATGGAGSVPPATGGAEPAAAARTETASVAPAAPAGPAAEEKPAGPTLVARIDLTSQRMTVSEGGSVIHDWKISSGQRGFETPPGAFRPSWASKMWYSRKYDGAPMPYAVFFNQGIATHGTDAVGRLGRPASHGCIRLGTPNARTFYRLVHRHGYKNTRIVVTGRAQFTRTATRATPSVRRRAERQPRRVQQRVRVSRETYAEWRARAQREYLRRRYSGRMVYPGDRW